MIGNYFRLPQDAYFPCPIKEGEKSAEISIKAFRESLDLPIEKGSGCVVQNLVLYLNHSNIIIEVQELSTRYFTPVHRDGSPYSINLNLEGLNENIGGDFDCRLTPEEAITLGKSLIKRGKRCKEQNEGV